MTSITNSKKKEIAEDLYIRAGLTAKEISNQIDISEVTLSKWKKEGDWEKRKLEVSLSPLRIKELLLAEAHKIANGDVSKIDSDKLSKIMASIDRLDNRVSVRVIMDVFREFDNYMAEINPKMAIEFTVYHKKFLQHRIQIEEQHAK